MSSAAVESGVVYELADVLGAGTVLDRAINGWEWAHKFPYREPLDAEGFSESIDEEAGDVSADYVAAWAMVAAVDDAARRCGLGEDALRGLGIARRGVAELLNRGIYIRGTEPDGSPHFQASVEDRPERSDVSAALEAYAAQAQRLCARAPRAAILDAASSGSAAASSASSVPAASSARVWLVVVGLVVAGLGAWWWGARR